MKAKELMTPGPICCSPSETIQEVARSMRENDCGSIPVVREGRIVGIVTDRDLAIRALARGLGADTPVSDVMTESPDCCDEDEDLRTIERVMADRQVRRVPIVNADGNCVGIIAQADIALASTENGTVSDREVAATVSRISEPAGEASTGERLNS